MVDFNKAAAQLGSKDDIDEAAVDAYSEEQCDIALKREKIKKLMRDNQNDCGKLIDKKVVMLLVVEIFQTALAEITQGYDAIVLELGLDGKIKDRLNQELHKKVTAALASTSVKIDKLKRK